MAEVLADARGTTDSTPADAIKNMTQDTIDKILDAKKKASRWVKSRICLLPEPAREQQLAEMIRESPIANVRGDNDGDDRFYVAIVLEVRHTGESVTRPALRPPPLQQEHARKLIKGAIAGRLEDPAQGITEHSLAPGDQYVFFDAGRHGPAIIKMIVAYLPTF